jgi:hypothetical protein
MKFSRLLMPGLLVALGGLPACTANIHDNTINIPNATVNATTDADVNNIMPEQVVPVTLDVKNVTLVDPATTPPADHVADAGHVQIYLDTTSTPPLVVTAQTTVMVTIPKETMAGHHKLICRVHKHDGTPTSTTFELSFTVKVTVTTTPDGGTTVDSSVTVEVGTTTTVVVATDAAAIE